MTSKILFLIITSLIACGQSSVNNNNSKRISKITITDTAKTKPISRDAVDNIDTTTYPFRTQLKNNYSLFYCYDSTMQYLVLKRKNIAIDTISGNNGEPGSRPKSLGFVFADFNDYFAFMQSFGLGNPYYVRLLKKETGSTIFKTACWGASADTLSNFLLYISEDKKLILFDIIHNKRTDYILSKSKNTDGMGKSIKLENVNTNSFTVSYFINDKKRFQKYQRK